MSACDKTNAFAAKCCYTKTWQVICKGIVMPKFKSDLINYLTKCFLDFVPRISMLVVDFGFLRRLDLDLIGFMRIAKNKILYH